MAKRERDPTLEEKRAPPNLRILSTIPQVQNAPAEQLDGKEISLRCFRHMLMARLMEEKTASLYRAGGKIVGGVYSGRGQEAFSAAMTCHLIRGVDVYGPLIRDQAGRIAFGEPAIEYFQTYLGSALGPMRGRDGNIHRGRPTEGMPAMISHLGSLISVVSGMLLARRLQGKEGFVGATSIGDGGTSTGSTHEGLNQAAVEKLPLVIAIANNQFAYSTPTEKQYACGSLVERGKGYGIPSYEVDGTDMTACLKVFGEAMARARAGGGPQIVVGSLLRLSGHGEHDDASYIPEELKQSSQGRDCLDVAKAQLLASKWATEKDFGLWEQENRREIEQCILQASQEPTPDPYSEGWRALSSTGLSDEYSHSSK